MAVMEWDTRSRDRGTQALRHLAFTDSLVDMLNASTREQTFPDDVQKTGSRRSGHGGVRQGARGVELWSKELVYSMDRSVSPYLRCSGAGFRRAENMDHLYRICVPTVLINGRAETVQDFVVEPIYYPIGAMVQPLRHWTL